MCEEIEATIKIPAPPEGWGNVEFRQANPGDMILHEGAEWEITRVTTFRCYIVASKLTPPWQPPPEWYALFGDCWLTRDKLGHLELYCNKPVRSDGEGIWEGAGFNAIEFMRSELMPPADIPWTECCWKIEDTRKAKE